LQVGEHQFVEKKVIEMWMSLMDTWYDPSLSMVLVITLFRVSASSCANIYNCSFLQSKVCPPGWPVSFAVSPEHVWDAFILRSLLEDAMDHKEFLVVTHSGTQHIRFTELVQAHNQRMRLEGQPEISHFCN
jgi:hypothetical protein